MKNQILTILASIGLLSGIAVSSAFAQQDDKMANDKMSNSKMSGSKMSHKQMMDKMNAMSADDKAAMFDKMTEKEKMSAMKMSHSGKMSHQESMDMMGKMSNQEKADMFDKMPMEKKMAMMKGDAMMMQDHKKMDK